MPARLIAVALAGLLGCAGPAMAGDAAAGKIVFNKCRTCHEAARETNKLGPHLIAIIGRPAGSLESFEAKYSEAMRTAGANGLVWDEATLAAFLRAPKDVVPGTKMAFAGMTDDTQIADLIAYLAADPKP